MIGEILDTNRTLVPITVTEFGMFGSLFMRFFYGTEATTLPKFKPTEPNTKRAAILTRTINANNILRHEHPDGFYGFSYRAIGLRLMPHSRWDSSLPPRFPTKSFAPMARPSHGLQDPTGASLSVCSYGTVMNAHQWRERVCSLMFYDDLGFLYGYM